LAENRLMRFKIEARSRIQRDHEFNGLTVWADSLAVNFVIPFSGERFRVIPTEMVKYRPSRHRWWPIGPVDR